METALAQLPKLEKAKQLLAQCTRVDEAKRFHDIAEAARQFARMNGLGLEAQNLATEIKVRAGRRAGELLKVAARHRGGRPKKNGNNNDTVLLAEIGFDKRQSSRFQRLAAVPAKALEQYFDSVKESGREITTTAVLRMGKAAKNNKPKPPPSGAVGCITDLSQAAGMKFGAIYADPPWAYSNNATRANVRDEYAGTMTVDQICAMPVGDFAAADSHIWLWTTVAFGRDAYLVLDAWGFEFKSEFIWCKSQMGIGNYFRLSHEKLYLGVRGNATRFDVHDIKSWAEFPRGKHSAKPEEVRGFVERCSPGPYLELFGRSEMPGWTVFGNCFAEQRRLA